MFEKSKRTLGYDPISEDELPEEPSSSSHTDLPDPSDGQGAESEDPELRERMERARERIRRRNEERNRPYKESAT